MMNKVNIIKAILKISSLFILCLLVINYYDNNSFSNKAEGHEEIVVFAAASLTESFTTIKEVYESEHENIDIILNFAGSQVLKSQILSGADPSMFFSANMKYPNELVDRKYTTLEVSSFAKNELVIISSDRNISSFEQVMDLVCKEDVSIVIAHEDVPVGRYSFEFLELLRTNGYQEFYHRFYEQVVSYENDVKSVLAKVKLQEVDLGLVYKTDGFTEKDLVSCIQIPDKYLVSSEYGSIMFKTDETNQEFYNYILEGEGRQILEQQGFDVE